MCAVNGRGESKNSSLILQFNRLGISETMFSFGEEWRFLKVWMERGGLKLLCNFGV